MTLRRLVRDPVQYPQPRSAAGTSGSTDRGGDADIQPFFPPVNTRGSTQLKGNAPARPLYALCRGRSQKEAIGQGWPRYGAHRAASVPFAERPDPATPGVGTVSKKGRSAKGDSGTEFSLTAPVHVRRSCSRRDYPSTAQRAVALPAQWLTPL